MTRQLCAVLLAAGLGTRLRPLTELVPKALCPVGNRPILDRNLQLVADLGLQGPAAVAVNASWLGQHLTDHVAGRAYVSREPPVPLGTAGGVANLREWIADRAVLAGNADAYLAGGGLDPLLAGWDGETVRLLGVSAEAGMVDTFGQYVFAGFSLLPGRWVRRLPVAREELVHAVWRPAEAAGELEVIPFSGHFRDTGTVHDYLAANRHAAAVEGRAGNLLDRSATVTGICSESVVGGGAYVAGTLTRSVVWPGSRVGPDEHLADAVRAGDRVTVSAAAG